MQKEYTIETRNDHVTCKLSVDGIEDVCTCEISVDAKEGKWEITSWFTRDGFKKKGLGKDAMYNVLHFCKSQYGVPSVIQYVWNGANTYVMDWLEKNFDAVCTCPIVVLKTQPGDSPDAHIYELNKDKVLKYFGL